MLAEAMNVSEAIGKPDDVVPVQAVASERKSAVAHDESVNEILHFADCCKTVAQPVADLVE